MSGLAPTTIVLNVVTIFAYGPQADSLVIQYEAFR